MMKTLKNRHFWIIVFAFACISVLHYSEQIGFGYTSSPSLHFGLTRHSVDRILFLFATIYAAYVFGLVGGLVTCFAGLLVMLPRAISLSPARGDALLEVGAVVVIGIAVCLWLWTLAREREKAKRALSELESAHLLLQRYVRSARENEGRLTLLNAISTVLTESLDLEKVLHRAVHMVMELLDVEIVLIFSLDEKSQLLSMVAHEGVSEEFVRSVDKIRVGEGFNGEVARTGQPMTVADSSKDPRLSRLDVRKMKIHSQLIVPLTHREHIMGTICVAMRRPREFTSGETQLLNSVAAQVGSAMENARLYDEERLLAGRLAVSERNYRGLFESANDAIWVHDLAGTIIVANSAAARFTGYSVEELTHMNARSFLSDEGLNVAGQIRRKLMENEPVAQPYRQRLLRKDGSQSIAMLTTSLVTENGKPVAFQHIARDITEEEKMREDLRYYLSLITRVQEEERKRIARELHDETSQVLYALSRQVDNFVRSDTNLPASYASFLKEVRQHLNEALEGVHRFSQALRPPMLDDLGLLPTVRWLISDMQKSMKVEIDLRVSGAERRFSSEVELALFRIIQEALRNVWKHAQATRAQVAVEFFEDRVRVRVTDNGKGIEGFERIDDLPRRGKLGLAGINERMHLIGGFVKVETAPGKGTTLTAEAPV